MTDPIILFSGEYRFLSNFYSCTIIMHGETYRSTEHAYQAAKAADENRHLFRAAGVTASESKKLGKQYSKYTPEVWDAVKVGIMAALLARKFASGTPLTPLAQKLLDTGDAVLVEGNYWGDVFWGVCNGKGENWLGKLLMERREQLNSVK